MGEGGNGGGELGEMGEGRGLTLCLENGIGFACQL